MRTLAIALLAWLATDAPAAAADLEANKLLIRSYYEEVFNKRQPAASDRFVATDCSRGCAWSGAYSNGGPKVALAAQGA